MMESDTYNEEQQHTQSKRDTNRIKAFPPLHNQGDSALEVGQLEM